MGTTPHFPGYTAAWCNPKMKHLYKSGSTTVPGIPGYSIQTIPRPRQFQYGWVSPLRELPPAHFSAPERIRDAVRIGVGGVVAPHRRARHAFLAPSEHLARFSAESPSASSSSQAERGGLEAESGPQCEASIERRITTNGQYLIQ